MTLREVIKAVTIPYNKVNAEDMPYFADWLLDHGLDDMAADVRDCREITAYGSLFSIGDSLKVQNFSSGRIYRVPDAEGYVLVSIYYKVKESKA